MLLLQEYCDTVHSIIEGSGLKETVEYIEGKWASSLEAILLPWSSVAYTRVLAS